MNAKSNMNINKNSGKKKINYSKYIKPTKKNKSSFNFQQSPKIGFSNNFF